MTMMFATGSSSGGGFGPGIPSSEPVQQPGHHRVSWVSVLVGGQTASAMPKNERLGFAEKAGFASFIMTGFDHMFQPFCRRKQT